MVSIGIMQDVVTRAKRTAASARMTAEAARLEAEQELSARGIRRETAFAWLDVFEAQRRAATLRRLVVELTAERQVSEGGLSSGSMSASDILGIDAELSRLRDELIVAERDEARSRAMLSRWIGEHSMRPLPESLPHDLGAGVETYSASVDALGAHPSLESTQRAIDVAMHEVDRARAERRPDWSWQVMYGQRQDDRADMVSLQVTVGLPLNRADRQDQRVVQKLAMASAARNEMLDRRRLLASELAIVRVDLDASVAQLREHEERRLPAARARVATAEAAYAGGGQSLLEVWRARRDLLEVELHHDMILAGRARALSQLAWLVGETEVTP
jgi:outer membrane protein TolC